MKKRDKHSEWQLQTAKARFSELFRRVLLDGPQYVTRAGKEKVVVISAEDYERLALRSRQPSSLLRFLSQSPLGKAGIDLEREPDFGRKVDL